MQCLDFLADETRLVLGIPGAGDRHLFTRLVFRAQGLAEAALILGDEPGCGGENMAGGAVIALQAYYGGAGKVVLEAQDVVDLCAAPAIDRLVVVADAAQVLARLGKEPEPEILGHVGVLILVHQHVAETVLVLLQDVGMLAPQAQTFEQQVAEIDGIENLQPLLICAVESSTLAVGEGAGFTGGNLIGSETPVLPAVDMGGELACRPTLLVDALSFDHLLHQAKLIVGAEDGEVGTQTDQLRMAAQDLGADGVEGAEPLHSLGHGTDHGSDALAHLPRRLVGEGHGEDLGRVGIASGDQVRDPGGEHAGLAGAGARQYENRALGGLDSSTLLRVQAIQIGRLRRNRCTGAGAQGAGRRLMGKAILRIGSVVGLIHRRDHGSKGERRRARSPVDPAAGSNFRASISLSNKASLAIWVWQARRGMSHAFHGGPCHRLKPCRAPGLTGRGSDAPAAYQPCGTEHEGHQSADPAGSADPGRRAGHPERKQPDPAEYRPRPSFRSSIASSDAARRLCAWSHLLVAGARG